MTVLAFPSRAVVGGSTAAAACGIDPHKSRVMLWLEVTGRYECPQTEAMRWGNLLEPVVYAELVERGYELMPAPADGFRDPERPWRGCHPDAFAGIDGQRATVDIKTAGVHVGGWREGDEPPLAYVAQLQHNMSLTGDGLGLLACLVGGQRLEVRTIHRNDLAISAMVGLQEEFYEHVRTDTPPPPDGSDSAREALGLMFPTAREGATVRLTGDDYRAVVQLRGRRADRDALDAQIQELENRLKAVLGDAEHAIDPWDAPALSWRNVSSSRVDTKGLRAARPDIAAEFTTETTTRRFTVA